MQVVSKQEFMRVTNAYMEHKRKVRRQQEYDYINFRKGVFMAINKRISRG